MKNYTQQDLVDLQETFDSVGFKNYTQELVNEIKMADNNIHNGIKIEDIRYWQGYYKAMERVINMPTRLIKHIKEMLDKIKSE